MEIQLPEHNQTPHEIVQALDSYIIGQSDAKKAVAVALRNRWRRMQLPEDIKLSLIHISEPTRPY